MARKVFFSFHFDADNWRASQVRQMGALEGNSPCADNDWEAVKRGGDVAIKRWISGQLDGRTCAVVLVGSDTAKRKWIDYEIIEAWQRGLGVVGVHIHGLKDRKGLQSSMGANPFAHMTIGERGFASVVKCYAPPYTDSALAYNHIRDNLAGWIEEAITIRGSAR